eukprot:1923394-Amphidinium_carterae.1
MDSTSTVLSMPHVLGTSFPINTLQTAKQSRGNAPSLRSIYSYEYYPRIALRVLDSALCNVLSRSEWHYFH